MYVDTYIVCGTVIQATCTVVPVYVGVPVSVRSPVWRSAGLVNETESFLWFSHIPYSIMIQWIRLEVSLYIYWFNILTKEKSPLKIAWEKALWLRSFEIRHHRSFFTWCAHHAVQIIRQILRRECRISNIFFLLCRRHRYKKRLQLNVIKL
jgi:hypothetical protein